MFVGLNQLTFDNNIHFFIYIITFYSNNKKIDYVVYYKNRPDYPVSLAVRESSSIPYFFKTVKDKDNNILVDGGVLLNYPIELL